MFQNTVVVSSAVSAFNNAAIVSPAFFWNAILCAPLFVAIYLLGRFYGQKLGLVGFVNGERVSFWSIIMIALWVVLMGGNYDVLRDGVSLLPWVTAGILFVSCLFVGTRTRAAPLPIWYGSARATMRRRWWINIILFALLMVPVGFSDILNWWGPILQIGAVCAGLLIGRWRDWRIRAVPCMAVLMFAVVVALLMQPEFFRFGQLGNLTPIHLIGILMTGILLAAAVAVDVVPARARIHKSAFVKLKWLVRIGTALCMVLFLLTEAVPIFIATVFMSFVLFAMSVWHRESVADSVRGKILGLAVIMFGILIDLPTITAMGVFWISILNSGDARPDARFLL
ncbi:MAG: hypothetical protein J5714_02560 [Alphaproteobacteria bacterium]|nr:hypothetical protein [Alphaproteobacteria bacterium]